MSKTFDKELFEEMPVPKAVRKFVVPALASTLITIIYSLADTFFVGMLGDHNQVAALSLVFPFYQTLNAFGSLWGIGANSRLARSLGEKEYEKASQSSNIGFWYGAVFMAVFCVLFYVFKSPLLQFCGASENTYAYAVRYMNWAYVIGGVPTILSIIMSNLLRSEGHAKKASFGLMMGGILNCFLDPLMIFGFHMGIAGAAAATMISNCISLIFFLIFYCRIRKTSYIDLRPFAYKPEGKAVREILLVGLPSCCLTILGGIGCMCENKICSWYNDASVAAWGVVTKVNFVSIYSTHGVAQGVLPLIGYNYGARNYKRVREANRLAFKILLVIAFGLLILCEIFAPAIVKFFINDALTIEVGSVFLRIYILVAPMMSMILLISTLCQAIGRWKHSLAMLAFRQLIFHVPFMFILNKMIGINGVPLSQICCDFLSLFIAIYVYRKNFKKSLEQPAAQQE